MTFDLKTLNDLMLKTTARGDKPSLLRQEQDGSWKPISSAEFYARVRTLAAVFQGWGVNKGDRVILLSENRWEWPVTDFATLAIGAADVPVYATLNAEEVGYAIRDSGAKVAVLSSAEQYKKVTEAGELPSLEHVVVMDEGSFEGAESFSKLMQGWETRLERDPAFDALAAGAKPDDLATIIYTSGTTGQPKGTELTHGNMASNLDVSTDEFSFSDSDSTISYLPLSHVTARHLDYVMMLYGGTVAYCPEFKKMAESIKQVKPTLFVGVPRVYEKIKQAVEAKSAGSKLKSGILRWAVQTGQAHRDDVVAGKQPGGLVWSLANKLVYSKVREAFGGNVRYFVAGGAPLGEDLGKWYASVGIQVLEGYGLTETSPVIALNTPKNNRLGSVGRLLPNVQVRFAPDGEVEVKGPSIFHRYFNKEKETREAVTEDGWFKTGDIGKLEDGYLSITDRKKELLKTSGGKLVAPAPIEGKLKNNSLVGHAAMVGDKHKFACVLISPNFGALESWAKGQGVSIGDHAALVKDPKVVKEYERIVNEVNGSLQRYETMKRVTVVPDDWSVEGGEMTPSMKLKRRVIDEKYKAQIEEMYKDEANAKAD